MILIFLVEIAAGLGIRVAIKPDYRITPPVSFVLLAVYGGTIVN